ncbi:MAG: NAD+ synthase [Candidatus Brocadiae bacterium]|nr:NAD+ synthase [Candidatus Brocadiia bacterium]
MKIAIAQINTTAGDVEGNLEKVLDYIGRAAEAGAELAVFPELALSGWAPGDLLRERAFVEANERALAQVRAAARGIAVLLGHVGRDSSGRFASAASLLAGGERIATFSGTPLEHRDPWRSAEPGASGSAVGRAVLDGTSMAVAVGRPAPTEVTAETAGGADLFVSVSALPFRRGCAAERERVRREAASRFKVSVALANLVGGNGSLVFDGRSFILDADGRKVAEAEPFVEALLVADVDSVLPETAGTADDGVGELYEALKLGLADFVRKSGFSEAVLGLSGGIDSAVTAAIAADALGSDHVTALGMPSAYSSEATRQGAGTVAENLGIRYHILPIEEVRAAFGQTLAPLFEGRPSDVAEQNVQARIRGTLLMAYANKFGAMPLASGNRSEVAVGYCTLYGDMCGGLAPLSDLPKTMVYDIARWVNRDGEIIPANSLTKAPSAELRPNQTDQDTLPPYEELDRVLHAYIEEQKDLDDIVAAGTDRSAAEDIVRRIERAEYKRRQAVPGLKITSKAFGYGRRVPIAKKPPPL